MTDRRFFIQSAYLAWGTVKAKAQPSTNSKSRQVRRFFLTQEALLTILSGKPTQLDGAASQLPKDAEIVYLYTDFDSNCLVAIVWSSSFSPVAEGMIIPGGGPLVFKEVK